MKTLAAATLVLMCFASGCGRGNFSGLEDEFVYKTLAFSPTSATAAGLHSYGGQNLDQALDDISIKGFDRQRQFYTGFRDRLGKLKSDNLLPQDQADYAII